MVVMSFELEIGQYYMDGMIMSEVFDFMICIFLESNCLLRLCCWIMYIVFLIVLVGEEFVQRISFIFGDYLIIIY